MSTLSTQTQYGAQYMVLPPSQSFGILVRVIRRAQVEYGQKRGGICHCGGTVIKRWEMYMSKCIVSRTLARSLDLSLFHRPIRNTLAKCLVMIQPDIAGCG
jgi:hypothetical protein